MELELPPHLDSVRQRLAASLALHPADQAPATPSGLLEDLERHFDTSVMVPVREKRPWRDRLRSMLASPAFGIAAAVVVVIGFTLPSLFEPSSFRGGPTAAPSGQAVQIVLVDEPTGIRHMVETSGDFEAGAVASVDQLEKVFSILGPKVIVNFETGLLRAVDSAGTEYFSAPIPENTADLSTVIAEAITHL